MDDKAVWENLPQVFREDSLTRACRAAEISRICVRFSYTPRQVVTMHVRVRVSYCRTRCLREQRGSEGALGLAHEYRLLLQR